MPIIYLSPSTQESNLYVTGGSEEYYMNLLADALEPYLLSSGIQYVRNDRNSSAAAAIRESNRGSYGLHLALHSNAAPEGSYGSKQGVDVYYARGSANGRRAAEIFAENLKSVYPTPSLVRTLPTTTIGEAVQTRAPAVFLELGYHDNVSDANWVKNNIGAIAKNLALSVTQYFGVPLINPTPAREGIVRTSFGNLNLRQKPDLTSRVIAKIPNGTRVTVLGEWQGWDVVRYGANTGYSDARYVELV